MIVDKTTLDDLSIFNADEDQSVFNLLNHAVTIEGKFQLQQLLANPFSDLKEITETQQILKLIIVNIDHWPTHISNGTLMVIEKIFESQIDPLPKHPGFLDVYSYKIFHAVDYALIMYSVTHVHDFLIGLQQLINLLSNGDIPPKLSAQLNRMKALLNKDFLQNVILKKSKTSLSKLEKIQLGNFILTHYKAATLELIELYGKLDAYYALAKATIHLKLNFPEVKESDTPFISATELHHFLLKKPVPYNIEMSKATNFIFLTGANMAGKSTFIKAVGVSVYLAHIGMAVPAKHMQLSLFNGLLSNIQVMDNIVKGESYFFNEVQRIKTTISKISDGKKWLVLIDELFKGTNNEDAMRCSSTVIKGLLKIKNTLIILSTHLYETGHELEDYTNISFRYFETGVNNDQLSFSYQLKEGISNDRLGYLILKKEGVVDMLDRL